ncbi:hypothetical protein KFV02_07435 [Desulfohalobiaceae bacterium Ax17]|uniref:hypothetical protein n=1 Tax=Desulfovulcanus ferrireducens TaxID=2831190 RepID=UPI00207BC2D4|nr:hypothetical protein [Desulfovulcanus ferrireducens]MBT8763763.1 hypothetical protein [Desulfovulcanus ferrireducens]
MLSSLKIFQLISDWITTLWTGLPTKLRPTLLELLLGAIISNSGHITDAILAIKPVRTWTTYFKVIENGKFSWLILARNWTKLLIRLLGNFQKSTSSRPSITIMPKDKTGPNSFGGNFG